MKPLTLLVLFLASPLDDLLIGSLILFLKRRLTMQFPTIHFDFVWQVVVAAALIGGVTLLNLYLKARATR